MKAMIMAAGFGTRLRPLTEKIPKALVPVLNKPVLEHNIEYLNKHGIRNIIINAHYYSNQIYDFITSFKDSQINLTVSIEKEILGTGGGIANCREFLKDDTFVVINSDILTNINLNEAVTNHKESGDLVTMVLHDCSPFNQIEIDKNNKIKKINKSQAPERLAFTGIHILEPTIFNHLPKQGYGDIITDCYNLLPKSGESINTCIVKDHYWYDIGTIDSYKKANMDFLKFEEKQHI